LLNASDGGVMWEPEQKGKFRALIAEFRNEPDADSFNIWPDV